MSKKRPPRPHASVTLADGHAPPSPAVHDVGGGTIPMFTPIIDACAAAVATSMQA
jgi:hypothetical protein